jgi:hypothetical protein
VRILGGRAPVEVGGADLDGLVISLSPSVDIAGRVITEGVNTGAADNYHPIVILKSDLAGMPGRMSQIYAQFSGNRDFMINDAIEGDYELLLTDLPRGTYVKSIRFGAADVLNGGLRVESRSSDRLEIVLSSNGAVLDGAVVDRNREPVANAVVALVPAAARRHRADLYKNVSSDIAGRFHFDAIAPGDYLVFAWQEVEQNLWRDPNFLRRNEASGKLIHLGESGRDSVELNVIPFAF